jgi:hypothetical protein
MNRRSPMANRPAKDNSKALAAFMTRMVEIDTMLARLRGLSDDHFNVSPDDIHWGDVGTLAHYATKLREIADSAFGEGEYTE